MPTYHLISGILAW